MSMEKFIEGQFSPTKEEMEEAQRKGPEAVKALEEKFKKAEGRKSLKQTEAAREQLERDFKASEGKSAEEVREMINEELKKIERKE